MKLRALADILGISPAYLSDVEKGRRYPFSFDILKKISSALSISKEDERKMFDYAGVSKGSAPPDVCECLRTSPSAVAFFREAMERYCAGCGWGDLLARL